MDDDEMMYASEEEMVDPEAEEEETPENKYYEAKGLVEDSVSDAIEGFEKVLELETGKTEWGFKALKRLCKLVLQKKQYSKVLGYWSKFLEYIKPGSSVSPNAAEKGVNTLLDMASASSSSSAAAGETITKMYEQAVKALTETKNQKMLFIVNSKLAQALYDTRQFDRLEKVVGDMRKWCELSPGVDDPKKGAQLVEVLALEIQMRTALGQTRALKDLCTRALAVTAISKPKVLGVIRECGGLMNMHEHEWLKARQDFFDAFKNYDEAASPKRIQCLRYLVIASIMDLSNINPFESPETKPHASDKLVAGALKLWKAYEQCDVKTFEQVLEQSGKEIKDDQFVGKFVPELIRIFRSHVITRIVAPYSRVRIGFVGKEIGITEDQCEDLIVALILDNKIRGHVDQPNKVLFLETATATSDQKYNAVSRWSQQIASLMQTIPNRLV